MAFPGTASSDDFTIIAENPFSRLARGFIWFALFSTLFAFHAWSQFRGLRDPRAMEAAQLARNLADGRGFVTSVVRPADLRLDPVESPDRDAGLGHVRDLRQAPAYPLLLAAAFRAVRPSFDLQPRAWFAPEARVIVPLNCLLVLATGWLVFRMADRLFDRRAAILATIGFYLSRSVLDDTLSGTPDALGTLLVTASCSAAVSAAVRRRAMGGAVSWILPLAGSALCAGLAALTGYRYLAALPAILFFLIAGFDRGGWFIAFTHLLIAGAVVSPWLLRNAVASGQPFGNAPRSVLADSAWYPGDSLDRTPEPSVNNVKVMRSLQQKLVRGLAPALEGRLRVLGGGLLICFFLASCFHRFENEHAGAFRWATALGLLLFVGVEALAPDGGGLSVWWPAAAVCGAGFFFSVVDRAEFFQASADTLLAWALIAITAIPVALKLTTPAPHPYPPYHAPLAAFVATRMEPGEILATDIPWATAWYGNRSSLLLPADIDAFNRIREHYPELRGVYLTTRTGDRRGVSDLLSGSDAAWWPLFEGRIPAGFPFTHAIALPPGSQDQLFVTDRPRWPVADTP